MLYLAFLKPLPWDPCCPWDAEHPFHGRICTVQDTIPAFCVGGFGLDLGSVLRFVEKTTGILPGGECMAQRNSQEKNGEMRTEQGGEPGWLFGVTGRDRPRDGRARSLSEQGQLYSLQCHWLGRAQFWSYQIEGGKVFGGNQGEGVEGRGKINSVCK